MSISIMKFIKLLSAYTIIAIFCIAVFMLLAIISHLCYKLYRQENKNKAKQKQMRSFILITIAAVILFELALLLTIAVCTQIILIDAHAIHRDRHWIDHAFYDAFEYMEYFIAICDTCAHLCVIFVFISRYHHTFYNNTIFDHESALIRTLYGCALTLTIFGVIITVLIFIQHTVTEIIILEIIWEILVDFMCLWILYLFISKLYLLLKLSLQSHMQSGRKTDFVKELIEATKASIEQSKSDSKGTGSSRKSSKRSRYKSRSPEPKSMYTMTIDGMKIDPIKQSPNGSPAPSPDPHDPSIVNNMELTVTTKAIADPDDVNSDNDHTDNDQTDNENDQSGVMKGESAAMDLVGVMTKMTILVTFTVLVSVFGVIGNVFIEIQEMKYIETHDISLEELWAEVLPVIDVVITSLCLYLQFNFTHALYRKVFGRFDMWFLTQCLKCIEFVYKKDHTEAEKTASFLVETNSTKTLETLETR